MPVCDQELEQCSSVKTAKPRLGEEPGWQPRDHGARRPRRSRQDQRSLFRFPAKRRIFVIRGNTRRYYG
jgi:hypothetical protein